MCRTNTVSRREHSARGGEALERDGLSGFERRCPTSSRADNDSASRSIAAASGCSISTRGSLPGLYPRRWD